MILIINLLVSLAITSLSYAGSKSLTLPDDPIQSITYWKPYSISANQDPLVAKTQAVFSVLLRAWDNSRLEPDLYVVNSSAGPWAASLADGSILLTRSAIETIMSFGKDRAEHLLAFVLAHELAHQRLDDLWHQRFFRLIGNQNPEMKKQMLKGLELDTQLLTNIEQKEAQADHDGLIMMSSVGYDPYQILDKKDFFTAWVENIWQNSCSLNSSDLAVVQACRQAQRRALRARAQLTSVATQAMLYELGVQAFIAGRYPQARNYFTAYGRNYPNRAVLNALGLTYFAEALTIHHQLIQNQSLKQPAFYYPLLLDTTATTTSLSSGRVKPLKRSAVESMVKQQKKIMRKNIEQSINYFEKAIRLEPNHAKTYLLLAFSYLLDGNTFMVRGVIQGKYILKFGPDSASDLVLAMTSAIEGHKNKTQNFFEQLIHNLKRSRPKSPIPTDLLIYSAYYNSASYAEYLGQHAKAENLWKDMAGQAKSSGNGLLFRLSLNQMNIRLPRIYSLPTAPNINGLRIGDKLSTKALSAQKYLLNDLWIQGEQYQVYRFDNGSRFVVGKNKKIISAWQDSGQVTLSDRIALGDDADRPIKSMGIPDRRLHMMSGEYMAYDDYGVAIHIDNKKVAGWFLYNAKGP